MTRFLLGVFETGRPVLVEFRDFISLVEGMSIVSAADWGEDRFELGLSGGLMLRIFTSPRGLVLNVISTVNSGEISPVILTFPSEDQRPTLLRLQARLEGLRQLHALVYLLLHDNEKLERAAGDFGDGKAVDIGTDFLNESAELRIEAFGPGSWVSTVWTKTKEAKEALVLIAGLAYKEGRDAMLRRLRAETRLKELAVEEKEFELFSKKVDYIRSVANSSPNIREFVDAQVEGALVKLLEPQGRESRIAEIKSQLSGPDFKDVEEDRWSGPSP
jgi:hypothetical protein